MCHTRLTARSDPSLNFGEEEVGFGSLPIRPRYTAGPQGSAKCGAAAYTVRPSLGSRPMWYTPAPAKNGPATDHFLRSAEWKRNPPFFVPTATTTLSFLIVPTMSTTRHAGQDMHDVPRLQCHRGKRRHHEVFVQEQVHIRTSSAGLVDNPIPDSRERGIERLQHAGEVRCIEDDFVLSRRVRTEGGIRTRTPIRAISPADARDMTPPPEHGIHGETKRFWSAGVSQRGAESEDLSRVSPSGPLMDSEEILNVALRLAKQSETPADTTINVPAKDVKRTLFGIDVDAADLLVAKEKGYDLVIAHHPTGGSAILEFPKVLSKHGDILTRHGVPSDAAASAVRELQEEREPRAHAENYDLLPSVARLMGMGLMCIHNPCDEIGRRVMDETLRARLPRDAHVRDAISALETIPEFRAAKTRIVVRMGKAENPLGKWAVHHGAGTNGGVPVARAAFDHGIDTVFYIHIDAGALRRL